MRDDGAIKRRKLHETATRIVHTYMKTHKRNNHLIRFHAKGRVALPETYISIYIYICQSHVKTHHKRIIRRNNGVYIFDVLHMIQNPHLHVGPSHSERSNPYKRLDRLYLSHLAEGYSRI